MDSQLPIALARYLSAEGLEAFHVEDVGLATADDRVIWEYARERALVIITKDEDFQAMAARQASIPPQVVWVRMGNCRKAVLLQAFSKILPDLRAMLLAGDAVIEIR
ncbi:MAG: DUF5615 family PIN-like protein [Burkholderiales bacterium]